jgi:hypothetical protein
LFFLVFNFALQTLTLRNPALSQDNKCLADLLPGVIDGAIDIVLRAQGPGMEVGSNDEELLANPPPGYELLYDERSGYEFSA